MTEIFNEMAKIKISADNRCWKVCGDCEEKPHDIVQSIVEEMVNIIVGGSVLHLKLVYSVLQEFT